MDKKNAPEQIIGYQIMTSSCLIKINGKDSEHFLQIEKQMLLMEGSRNKASFIHMKRRRFYLIVIVNVFIYVDTKML